MSIATKQGLVSERVEHLNMFRRKMADLRIQHHALSQKAILVFNTKELDHYHDTNTTEEFRIEKEILISKYPDPEYIQNNFIWNDSDVLVDLLDKTPFMVFVTMTNLPRHLTHDDQIIIEDYIYTVAKASPIHRFNDGVQRLLIYNERNEEGYGILP